MRYERVAAVEGELLGTDIAFVNDVRAGIRALQKTLQPTLPQFTASDAGFSVQNLVGTVPLPSGRLLEVQPKVLGGGAWQDAVADLLSSTSRIVISGSREASLSSPRPGLIEAIAAEYARRLEAALSAEGPIEILQRETRSSARLDGRLDVTAWLRGSATHPERFVVTQSRLTVGNDFNRGMALVAGLLGRASVGGALGSRLRRLASALLPGEPATTHIGPDVPHRSLPPQWRKYSPAWSLAIAFLRSRDVIGTQGRLNGLEIAVEPWPLLETLLERAMADLMTSSEHQIQVAPKGRHPLIRRAGQVVDVIPDGLLTDSDGVIATLEAKYSIYDRRPKRSHVHQALATAGALGARRAILVYPGDIPPRRFDVVGFASAIDSLWVVGLDLYGGPSEALRALRTARLSAALVGA